MATYNDCWPANGKSVDYYTKSGTSTFTYAGTIKEKYFTANDKGDSNVTWISVFSGSTGGYAKRVEVDTSWCSNMSTSFFGTTNLSNSSTAKITVINLQFALRRLGYAVGTIDGKFGSNTEAAVKSFQKACGLSADGIVGSNTRASLVYELNGLG